VVLVQLVARGLGARRLRLLRRDKGVEGGAGWQGGWGCVRSGKRMRRPVPRPLRASACPTEGRPRPRPSNHCAQAVQVPCLARCPNRGPLAPPRCHCLRR
jgi:hypothetical protein